MQLLDSKRLNSVNSHRDREGRGREMQNGRFWTRLLSSRLQIVNSHTDRAGPDLETQNCRFGAKSLCKKKRSGRFHEINEFSVDSVLFTSLGVD